MNWLCIFLDLFRLVLAAIVSILSFIPVLLLVVLANFAIYGEDVIVGDSGAKFAVFIESVVLWLPVSIVCFFVVMRQAKRIRWLNPVGN